MQEKNLLRTIIVELFPILLLCCFITVFLNSGTFAAENPPAEPNQPEVPQPDVKISFMRDGELDLDAVVKHFEDMYRSTSSISEVELKITRPRTARELTMKIWTKGKDNALIVILSPAREKDMATLKVDKNLWNYLPRINRTIRIPASMMLSSWMGSDLTNDDIVRESSFSEDYTFSLTGRSETPAGWKVDFTAKPDIVGLWNKLELVVSDDGTIPLQAKYFDRKDRLSRTIVWEDVKDFGGRIIPSKMVLIPEDEPENKTEMIYKTIEFEVSLPEDIFSLSRLEQKR